MNEEHTVLQANEKYGAKIAGDERLTQRGANLAGRYGRIFGKLRGQELREDFKAYVIDVVKFSSDVAHSVGYDEGYSEGCVDFEL